MTGWMQRKANGCCEWGGYDLSCKRKNSQNTALRRGRVSAVVVSGNAEWRFYRMRLVGTSDPFLTFGFQEGSRNLPCTITCHRQRLWIFLKLITATGVYLLDRCAQVIAECKKTCAELYADDRSSLPGSGPDMFGRVRQCIRNCAADKECFNF